MVCLPSAAPDQARLAGLIRQLQIYQHIDDGTYETGPLPAELEAVAPSALRQAHEAPLLSARERDIIANNFPHVRGYNYRAPARPHVLSVLPSNVLAQDKQLSDIRDHVAAILRPLLAFACQFPKYAREGHVPVRDCVGLMQVMSVLPNDSLGYMDHREAVCDHLDCSPSLSLQLLPPTLLNVEDTLAAASRDRATRQLIHELSGGKVGNPRHMTSKKHTKASRQRQREALATAQMDYYSRNEYEKYRKHSLAICTGIQFGEPQFVHPSVYLQRAAQGPFGVRTGELSQ